MGFAISIFVLFIIMVYHFYIKHQLKQFKEDYFYKGKIKIEFSETINIDILNFSINKIYETKKGKYIFINNNECLFKVKIEYIDDLYFSWLFRGRLKITNDKMKVIGRISILPYFMLLFIIIASLIFGLTIFTVRFTLMGFFPLIIIILSIVLFIYSLKKEEKRFIEVYKDIRKTINTSK